MFSQKNFYKRLSLIIALLLILVTLSSCEYIEVKKPIDATWSAYILSTIIFVIMSLLPFYIYEMFKDRELERATLLFVVLCLLCYLEYKLTTKWIIDDTKQNKSEITAKSDSPEEKESSPNQSESERKLRSKISDIQRIRQELTQKQGEAVKTKELYRKDVDSYKSEINQVRGKLKISSYQGASGNQRVKGNIMLIQQRLAYIQSIEEIQNGIEAGIESLTTTERKIEGDLNYIKLLDKEKANQLLQEITRAIDANKQYVGEFVIKIDENKLKSPEKIWNEIVSGNL